MIISLPFKTPTVNHLYTRNKFGNQCKTAEANKLKKEIDSIIKALSLSSKELEGKKLKVSVEIYEDWLTKDGEVKKKDVANREKFIIDSIFESLGLDDKFVYELNIRKVQSEDEFAIIKIGDYI